MKNLESKAAAPEAEDSNVLNKEEKLDLEIAVAMAKKLISEGKGMDVIKSAVQGSQDPSSVIGQFFAQMFAQMQESFPAELEVSPRIYLAKGGVLEQLLDFIEEELGLPPEFSDQVFGATVETIKAAAQDPPAQEQAPAQDPQAAMPAPAQPPAAV